MFLNAAQASAPLSPVPVGTYDGDRQQVMEVWGLKREQDGVQHEG